MALSKGEKKYIKNLFCKKNPTIIINIVLAPLVLAFAGAIIYKYRRSGRRLYSTTDL